MAAGPLGPNWRLLTWKRTPEAVSTEGQFRGHVVKSLCCHHSFLVAVCVTPRLSTFPVAGGLSRLRLMFSVGEAALGFN